MNIRTLIAVITISAAHCMNSSVIAGGTPLGTAFTYQGELKISGVPATGMHHLRFQLWDALAGGAQVGSDVNWPAVAMSDGRFTVPLDFGVAPFEGSARWLQVSVVTNGGATVTPLLPRQPISATPYALQTRGIFADGVGNVGVGTASPQAKLHVNGGMRWGATFNFARSDQDASGLFIEQKGTGFSDSNIRTQTSKFGDSTNYAQFIIDPFDGFSFMRLGTGNGRVGIGTTTPTNELSVNGTADFAKVGIGTAFPTSTLHVIGLGNQPAVRVTPSGGDGLVASCSGPSRHAVQGSSSGIGGVGVSGYVANINTVNYGVLGHSDSLTGFDFYADGVGTDYGSSSSIRWKRNVEPIADPLGMLEKMRGVHFDWDEAHGGHHAVGMIAEEVGKVLPEIVNYEENGIDAIGMDYCKLTPLLVEAVKAVRTEKDAEIKAQSERIEAQEAVIQSQQSAIAELLGRIERLERAGSR